MKLSFKYTITKIGNKNLDIIKDLQWHVKKVCNMLLYDIREGKEKIDVNKNLNIISSKIYKDYRKNNWHSNYLHSHMLQEAIIGVIGSYKSYISLCNIYKKNKNSLRGQPRFPRFKKENIVQEIIFTKYAIRIEENKIKLSLSKRMQEKYEVKSLNFLIPRKLRKLVDFSRVKMIKIKQEVKNIEINVIYEREEKKAIEGNTNIMSIDLGLNNIVGCTNKDNSNSILISGKEAKSKNKYINEKIRKLQQIEMKMRKTSKKYKNTKQIKKLYEYRKNYMNTYMHKVSKIVIEYAKVNKCGVIVIGNLKDIKQGMNYNKNFVQIPLYKLVQKIEYKAKLEGIKVEKISEKYTSGVSALDREEIIKENYNKKRRISRGIFVTNRGIKINADINGSLNILRKYIKKSSPNQEIAMDNGREQRPLKKRVA